MNSLKKNISISLNYEKIFDYINQELLKEEEKPMTKREKKICSILLNSIETRKRLF